MEKRIKVELDENDMPIREKQEITTLSCGGEIEENNKSEADE